MRAELNTQSYGKEFILQTISLINRALKSLYAPETSVSTLQLTETSLQPAEVPRPVQFSISGCRNMDVGIFYLTTGLDYKPAAHSD